MYASKTLTTVIKLTDFFFSKSLGRVDTWTHVDRRSVWRTTAVTFCPGTKFVPANMTINRSKEWWGFIQLTTGNQ